jgi:hypothetical protein
MEPLQSEAKSEAAMPPSSTHILLLTILSRLDCLTEKVDNLCNLTESVSAQEASRSKKLARSPPPKLQMPNAKAKETDQEDTTFDYASAFAEPEDFLFSQDVRMLKTPTYQSECKNLLDVQSDGSTLEEPSSAKTALSNAVESIYAFELVSGSTGTEAPASNHLAIVLPPADAHQSNLKVHHATSKVPKAHPFNLATPLFAGMLFWMINTAGFVIYPFDPGGIC